MGWNAAYTIFEQTVIGAYDLGKLDKPLLAVLMEPYRGSDIDSGGERGLKTRDGKTVVEVVVAIHGVSLPPRPNEDDEDAVDEWCERRDEEFDKITNSFDWC